MSTSSSNSLGLASLICGVLALVFLFLNCCGIPVVGMLSPVLAVLALVLGWVARSQAPDDSQGTAGAALGCVTLILYTLLMLAVFGLVGAYIAGVAALIAFGN